jgi:hypothetical protein
MERISQVVLFPLYFRKAEKGEMGRTTNAFRGNKNINESVVGRFQGTRPVKFINPLEHEICLINTNQDSFAFEKKSTRT